MFQSSPDPKVGCYLVDLEGFEPCTIVDSTQLIDSTKRQKRHKRSKRQFEVHGVYTDCCAGELEFENPRVKIRPPAAAHRYEGRSLPGWLDPEPTLLVGRAVIASYGWRQRNSGRVLGTEAVSRPTGRLTTALRWTLTTLAQTESERYAQTSFASRERRAI